MLSLRLYFDKVSWGNERSFIHKVYGTYMWTLCIIIMLYIEKQPMHATWKWINIQFKQFDVRIDFIWLIDWFLTSISLSMSLSSDCHLLTILWTCICDHQRSAKQSGQHNSCYAKGSFLWTNCNTITCLSSTAAVTACLLNRQKGKRFTFFCCCLN